jgi:hypothetical protein
MRNAHQILDIITAAFGSQNLDQESTQSGCSNAGSDYKELACQWNDVSRRAPSGPADTLDSEWVSATVKVIHDRSAPEDCADSSEVATESPESDEQHGQ